MTLSVFTSRIRPRILRVTALSSMGEGNTGESRGASCRVGVRVRVRVKVGLWARVRVRVRDSMCESSGASCRVVGLALG